MRNAWLWNVVLGCCTRARNGSNSNLGLKKKVKSKCWLMVQNKATCHEKKIQVINYLRIATASISKFILHVPGGVDGINLVCRDGAGDRLRHLAIVGDVSNAQSLACRCSASNGRPGLPLNTRPPWPPPLAVDGFICFAR